MSDVSDSEALVRALSAVRSRNLDNVVGELQRWSEAAGGWQPVFAAIGRVAAEAIEATARTAPPEEIAAGVATRASWVRDLEAGVVELVVRAFIDSPQMVAGLPSDGVSLVCLLVIDWAREEDPAYRRSNGAESA